jgi:hypothetical protein
MSPKKKSEKVIVTEEMNLLVDEIKALVKVRDALSYGTKSGSAKKAESVMSRRINNRVIQLSEHILDTFGKEEKNK